MSQNEPEIPWSQVVQFIGQLNHDLRNHLNAIELQSAFLGEIVEGAEPKKEIKRLREMTAEVSAQLQRLSRQLGKFQLSPMPYGAGEFVEDLQSKVRALHPEAEINWEVSLGTETIEVDPHLALEAFLELWANALSHERGAGPLVFEAAVADHFLVCRLREPKPGPVEADAEWGARPLGKLRHGHYALGLFRARSIFEAHHGVLQATYDSSSSVLTTTVRLPLAGGEE